MQAAAARAAAKAAKATNLERRAVVQQQQALAEEDSGEGDGNGAGPGAGADAAQPSSRPEPVIEALDGAGGGPLVSNGGAATSPIYPDEMTTTQQRIVKGRTSPLPPSRPAPGHEASAPLERRDLVGDMSRRRQIVQAVGAAGRDGRAMYRSV